MTSHRFAADAVEHLTTTVRAIAHLEDELERIERWGRRLAQVLAHGGRLLAAGNGGSAAHAQHLTSELVGRYRDERMPLSAIALHGETSTLTAVLNDYGAEEVFARQVRAHGRPGDVLLELSTSGRSPNLLAAAEAGHAQGMHVWAVTGPAPCLLASLADDALCVRESSTAVVQEVHQVAVHLLCEALESWLPEQATAFPVAHRG